MTKLLALCSALALCACATAAPDRPDPSVVTPAEALNTMCVRVLFAEQVLGDPEVRATIPQSRLETEDKALAAAKLICADKTMTPEQAVAALRPQLRLLAAVAVIKALD